MKKGFLIGAVGAILVALAALFLYKSYEKNDRQAEIPAAEASSDLPWLPLIAPDSTQYMAKSIRGKAVLILFQPDCDHCQREAVQIEENLHAFKGYDLYFISDAPLDQLEKFAQAYKLGSRDNVHFAHTSVSHILNTYGPVASPSLYIYSEKGKLKKAFNGETPISEIRNYL